LADLQVVKRTFGPHRPSEEDHSALAIRGMTLRDLCQNS